MFQNFLVWSLECYTYNENNAKKDEPLATHCPPHEDKFCLYVEWEQMQGVTSQRRCAPTEILEITNIIEPTCVKVLEPKDLNTILVCVCNVNKCNDKISPNIEDCDKPAKKNFMEGVNVTQVSDYWRQFIYTMGLNRTIECMICPLQRRRPHIKSTKESGNEGKSEGTGEHVTTEQSATDETSRGSEIQSSLIIFATVYQFYVIQ